MKIPIAGLLPEELNERLGLSPKYRGEQLFKWVQSGVTGFSEMTNLSREARDDLDARATLRSSTIDETYGDDDGTVKLRIRLADGLAIETVLLSDPTERKTACVSSQAGCGMGCSFCKTATMGLRRNLEAHEIIEQLFHIVEGYGEVSNIVFMGMGEPLHNLDNVRRAITVLHRESGRNIGLRRITISTCGITSGIRELAKNGPHTRLAISLPSAIQSKRERLMHAAKSNPLPSLKDALVSYGSESNQRITIETVLLRGVNDEKEDADALALFADGIDADVNIIPWNPASGIRFERPEPERVRHFASLLAERGVRVVQRFLKGNGIMAACGQLACE